MISVESALIDITAKHSILKVFCGYFVIAIGLRTLTTLVSAEVYSKDLYLNQLFTTNTISVRRIRDTDQSAHQTELQVEFELYVGQLMVESQLTIVETLFSIETPLGAEDYDELNASLLNLNAQLEKAAFNGLFHLDLAGLSVHLKSIKLSSASVQCPLGAVPVGAACGS
jgi:hypothetical protein